MQLDQSDCLLWSAYEVCFAHTLNISGDTSLVASWFLSFYLVSTPNFHTEMPQILEIRRHPVLNLDSARRRRGRVPLFAVRSAVLPSPLPPRSPSNSLSPSLNHSPRWARHAAQRLLVHAEEGGIRRTVQWMSISNNVARPEVQLSFIENGSQGTVLRMGQ